MSISGEVYNFPQWYERAFSWRNLPEEARILLELVGSMGNVHSPESANYSLGQPSTRHPCKRPDWIILGSIITHSWLPMPSASDRALK